MRFLLGKKDIQDQKPVPIVKLVEELSKKTARTKRKERFGARSEWFSVPDSSPNFKSKFMGFAEHFAELQEITKMKRNTC